MSNRTLILITLLVIITTGLVLIALNSPYSPPVTPPISTIAPRISLPVEQTVLSFDEPFMATESGAQNPVYSLPLVIDTGKNAVTAVQVELGFDPKVLVNVTVNPGSFFNNPIVLLNDVDQTAGKIYYALGISPQDNGIRGEGAVVIINFQAKAAKPEATTITFLPKTLITAEGVSQSVLKTTNSSQFTVR